MSSEWHREATDFLIQEYEKHPVLYDMRHPRYYNKSCRNKALAEMVTAIDSNARSGTTRKDVLRKIQTMRTQFGQELAKARRQSHKGVLYEPTVWWYKGLSFLKPHIKHRSDLPPMANEAGSWKQDQGDNESTYNVSIVRNGDSSQSPNDLNPDYDHSADDMEYETEIHYEIDQDGLKSMDAVELKPIVSQAIMVSNKRESRNHDRKMAIKSAKQTSSSGEQAYVTRDSSINNLNDDQQEMTTVLEVNPNDDSMPEGGSTNALAVIDDRYRSLGSFVAAQMVSIKDDCTFYETQMEILNVMNKGILRQLALDKEQTKLAAEEDQSKRKTNKRSK